MHFVRVALRVYKSLTVKQKEITNDVKADRVIWRFIMSFRGIVDLIRYQEIADSIRKQRC